MAPQPWTEQLLSETEVARRMVRSESWTSTRRSVPCGTAIVFSPTVSKLSAWAITRQVAATDGSGRSTVRVKVTFASDATSQTWTSPLTGGLEWTAAAQISQPIPIAATSETATMTRGRCRRRG